jgi:hypothetical protein
VRASRPEARTGLEPTLLHAQSRNEQLFERAVVALGGGRMLHTRGVARRDERGLRLAGTDSSSIAPAT